MGIRLIESELPFENNSIGECFQCKKIRRVRQVKIYSAFGGYARGYQPLCFHCFGPVFRWQKTELKESHTYETPYNYNDYMPALLALEPAAADAAAESEGTK